MKTMKKAILLLTILLFANAGFAGCASDAYHKACASCQFDAGGKIDSSCQGGYQSSGTACVSTSYPIMSAKYAKGECSEVDACAAELRSCTAQYSSGDDKADCSEGSVSVCYSAADQCVKSAAVKCGEIESPCKLPAAIFGMIFFGAGFAMQRKKRAQSC